MTPSLPRAPQIGSRQVVEALRKLAAEVGGLKAFEPGVRDAIGNTNWTVLMQRLDEADAALSRTAQAPVDVRKALEKVAVCARDWCDAVSRNTSWDGWDHHYKRMKYALLPSLDAALASSPAQVEARSDDLAVERAAKAAYENWIEPVRDLEPSWDSLPDSHRERLMASQRAALRTQVEAKDAPAAEIFAGIIDAIRAGFTDNGSDAHRIKASDGTAVIDGWIVGPTADDIRNTFVTIREIAETGLAALQEAEGELYQVPPADAERALDARRSTEGAAVSEATATQWAVKALEWEPDHGIAGLGPYRLFQAQTPLGRYAYGTDAEGNSYWHSSSSGVFMTGDEATAKRLAEAAWEKTATAEAGKFIVLSTLVSSDPAPAKEAGGDEIAAPVSHGGAHDW